MCGPGPPAVVLVLSEKAEIVHESGDEYRSERLSVAVPSVVRLRYYVRVPYERATALSRRAVFHRDGGRCQYCGGSAESIDHVVPRSRGGSHVWENVVAACRRCNAAKGDRLLAETPMTLRTRPATPHDSAGSSWRSPMCPSCGSSTSSPVASSRPSRRWAICSPRDRCSGSI